MARSARGPRPVCGFLLLTSMGWIGSLAGCAPAVLNETPATWPDPWQGRSLFNTPRAYIYASTPELAGQFDRMADRVADEFERSFGRAAPKGLLIVCDDNDPPISDDIRALFVASLRSSKMRELGREPTEEEIAEGREGLDEMKDNSGCDPDDAIASSAFGLEEEQMVAGLGLPPDVAAEARWAAVLPSDAMVRVKMRKLMKDSLDHAEVGIMARIAAAPILLALEPKMAGMMEQIRKAVVFQQMAMQQVDWSAEQVAKLSKAYAEGVMRPAMEAMQAEIERQATTRPVDTQVPASAPASGPSTAPCGL